MSRKYCTWEQRYEQLLEYRNIHNNCKVPINHDKELYEWIHRQRKYRKDNSSVLTTERIEKLNKIQFEWNAQSHTPKKSWDERFNELVQYIAAHGTCSVKKEENKTLHNWYNQQRQKFFNSN